MHSADLLKYVKDPALLDEASVGQLQQVVKDFPYFQTAHLLLSVASKKWDSSVFQQSLKKTAIVVSNRTHLYHLIHRADSALKELDVSNQVQTAVPAQPEKTRDLNILKETEAGVDEMPPIEPKEAEKPEKTFEKEIEKQVVASFVEKEMLNTPSLQRPIIAREEPESFVDWLTFLKKQKGPPYSGMPEASKGNIPAKKSGQPETENAANEAGISRKQKNKALIDKIIEKNPGLIRTKEEQKFYTPDLKAKESLLENEHLVTETLARIYALQGNINKAIRAYEILSLKNPQKSAYFASLIEKLKNH